MFTRFTIVRLTDKYRLAITSDPDKPPEVPNYSPFLYHHAGKRTQTKYFVAGYIHALQPGSVETSLGMAEQLITSAGAREAQPDPPNASIVVEHELV